eukprot:CAMPEP_0171518438 /NCGR_PEP_ID=MMETSP0959-20130129/5269_1 /TAXON_ID=87120 /ORGANISM="Aurantiochytrium limacinum, Strain ATCCMYA-1381" /LENGTH=110 /DNA_ID=CAMNT_0012057613 /DNA_START=405 /DNA_END=737 /DNA_ORIENTATION=-
MMNSKNYDIITIDGPLGAPAKSALKNTDKDLTTLAGIELPAGELVPFDVIVETLLGVIIATLGAMMNAGKMLPIDGSVLYNKVRYEDWWDSANFRTYNHRSKWLKERLAK